MSDYNVGKDIASIEMRLRRLEEIVYGSVEDTNESGSRKSEGTSDHKEAAD